MRSGGVNSKLSDLITRDVTLATAKISSSHLCAIPTETVYGLAANAADSSAVQRVFQAKGRPTDHPLIVHVQNLEIAKRWLPDLPEWSIALADHFWPGPLTIVGARSHLATDFVTAGQNTVAVRVPHHPVVQELLRELSCHGILGLVAPSANKFGHVSPTTAEHVRDDLGEYLSQHSDVILDGGPCEVGLESTIVLATGDQPVILRPGAITSDDIYEVTGITPSINQDSATKVSGNLASHYSPRARVELIVGENAMEYSSPAGFLALSDSLTPIDLVRLASPKNTEEFATILYAALREGDRLNLPVIYVKVPSEGKLSTALLDRLGRAAHQGDFH